MRTPPSRRPGHRRRASGGTSPAGRAPRASCAPPPPPGRRRPSARCRAAPSGCPAPRARGARGTPWSSCRSCPSRRHAQLRGGTAVEARPPAVPSRRARSARRPPARPSPSGRSHTSAAAPRLTASGREVVAVDHEPRHAEKERPRRDALAPIGKARDVGVSAGVAAAGDSRGVKQLAQRHRGRILGPSQAVPRSSRNFRLGNPGRRDAEVRKREAGDLLERGRGHLAAGVHDLRLVDDHGRQELRVVGGCEARRTTRRTCPWSKRRSRASRPSRSCPRCRSRGPPPRARSRSVPARPRACAAAVPAVRSDITRRACPGSSSIVSRGFTNLPPLAIAA